jgi:hypothetical protein
VARRRCLAHVAGFSVASMLGLESTLRMSRARSLVIARRLHSLVSRLSRRQRVNALKTLCQIPVDPSAIRAGTDTMMNGAAHRYAR